MKSKPPPPCRLQFLLARRAPVGVIFRRGPSNWVQIIKWDTRRDVFEEGQWFHGHIYVGRSDLSPDGSLLIYFANKFNQKTVSDREYTCAWTAVSKPPFLAALALWPKGDCWHGSGLFTTSRDVFLNHRPDAAEPHPEHVSQGIRVASNPNAIGKDDGVMVPRMERDGWKILQGLQYDHFGKRTIRPAIFEKEVSKGTTRLRVEKYFDPEEQWLCSVVTRQGRHSSWGRARAPTLISKEGSFLAPKVNCLRRSLRGAKSILNHSRTSTVLSPRVESSYMGHTMLSHRVIKSGTVPGRSHRC